MSDNQNLRITPPTPVGDAAPVQPVRHEHSAGATADRLPVRETGDVAATTGGNLPPAYAQFVVNPDTHDVVIRICDANTHRVVNEFPAPEIQAMQKYLKAYSDSLARQRAALRSDSAQ